LKEPGAHASQGSASSTTTCAVELSLRALATTTCPSTIGLVKPGSHTQALPAASVCECTGQHCSPPPILHVAAKLP
jgi:hypothetical protein